MVRDRLGEGLIVFGPEYIGFIEQDIERDRLGVLARDLLDQFTVDRARPRPATGLVVELLERFLVDIDDHHPVG